MPNNVIFNINNTIGTEIHFYKFKYVVVKAIKQKIILFRPSNVLLTDVLLPEIPLERTDAIQSECRSTLVNISSVVGGSVPVSSTIPEDIPTSLSSQTSGAPGVCGYKPENVRVN